MNGGEASPDLPRVLVDTGQWGPPSTPGATRGGAVWNLAEPERDLDANVITLPPGDGIGEHEGPDLDVLIHVLSGRGQLHTEADPVDLRPGLLVWLPQRSRRQFSAGPDGLTYLTVHQRRRTQGLWPSGAQRADPAG